MPVLWGCVMCRHELWAGITADGREFVYDCAQCERRREWAAEDDRDAVDDAASAREWREDNNND